jgi:hypothetical protein
MEVLEATAGYCWSVRDVSELWYLASRDGGVVGTQNGVLLCTRGSRCDSSIIGVRVLVISRSILSKIRY